MKDFLRGARGELLLRSSPRIYFFILPRQNRHIREHILQKDAVSRGGVVDEDVGDGTDELAVLNDGRADGSVLEKGESFLTKN